MKILEDRKSTIGLRKLSLTQYINILDRLLDKKFADAERDAIFNDDDNIELISKAYEKGIHPKKIFKKLSTDPVDMMYASSDDMNESIYENSTLELTPGQMDAVNFLEPMGLTFISNDQQIKNGTLVFSGKNKLWGIFKSGYIRGKVKESMKKPSHEPPSPWSVEPRWQVLYYHGNSIDDEEYLELAQILSEKVRRFRNKKSYRVSKVNEIYKELKICLEKFEGNHHYDYGKASNEEINLALEKIHKKYKK